MVAIGVADGLKQGARAIEIDVIALVEVDLGFAGDDAGEVEDHLGFPGDQLLRRAGRRHVTGNDVDLTGKARRLFRHDDIGQRELVDRLAVQPAVSDQTGDQLASDHAGRAGHHNMHWRFPFYVSCVSSLRLCGAL